MKTFARFTVSLLLIVAFLSNALPCGPGYTTPLFEVTNKPENPYADFASGRLGIVMPTFSRAVLYVAYRYINGGVLPPDEQKAMIDVWKADFDNKDYRSEDLSGAVKAWIDKRKSVVGDEEKVPDIYVERSYGGYEFFPNCTQNAFEVAAETLSDRTTSNGPTDKNVKDWVAAQDKVFHNCASGKQMPDAADLGAPQWLQKDRAYQMAAASFYSLDYADAKRRFAEIAQDTESPWQETADYLVGRTLVRHASLTKDEKKAAGFYAEAEDRLQHFVSRSGKFSNSAEKMMGLIAYRIHPKERVSELAKKLSFQGGNDNFRQDVIDYNWLLDKFESEVLTAEEKRKNDEAERKRAAAGNAATNTAFSTPVPSGPAMNANVSKQVTRTYEDDLQINLYSTDYQKSWTFYVRFNATDEEAIAEAEKVVGQPLSEDLKKRVREARQSAYASQFTENLKNGYEGNYYGEERLSPSVLPEFLRQDPLTDWLFTFQMAGPEAYLYSLKKFRETGAELWLMTALSKADKSSTDLARLFEAANQANRTSPGYLTIAYHVARVNIELGKAADARKLIDEMLDKGDDLPISARNAFIAQRLRLADTLEDFLKHSLKRPYAFDFDGESGTIDEFIAQQKLYYDPEYNKDGREAFDKEIEDRFAEERLWQDRMMFDSDAIAAMNQHFPLPVLVDVEKSEALPDYLRERFAVAIWTRAILLSDQATADKIAPELIRYRPEFEPFVTKILTAKTPAARQNATIFFIVKNPLVTPYLEEGLGKTDNEFGNFDSNDWWCSSYEMDSEEAGPDEYGEPAAPRPKFLTAAQSQAAKAERKKLKSIGDAPAYLATKAMDWAKKYPTDRRVPEALYIVWGANGWTKYGCGNNSDVHDEIGAYLKKHYPNNEWTAKIAEEEGEK